ncbi:uncharacterized protein VTP21DRAFT_91 [Calcarisporiella thermophila]|uniref:uncharacterized protein n=1 Tax=Calcarisporiella thermophila TaxID=911321 RepID=UPI0037443CC6
MHRVRRPSKGRNPAPLLLSAEACGPKRQSDVPRERGKLYPKSVATSEFIMSLSNYVIHPNFQINRDSIARCAARHHKPPRFPLSRACGSAVGLPRPSREPFRTINLTPGLSPHSRLGFWARRRRRRRPRRRPPLPPPRFQTPLPLSCKTPLSRSWGPRGIVRNRAS